MHLYDGSGTASSDKVSGYENIQELRDYIKTTFTPANRVKGIVYYGDRLDEINASSVALCSPTKPHNSTKKAATIRTSSRGVSAECKDAGSVESFRFEVTTEDILGVDVKPTNKRAKRGASADYMEQSFTVAPSKPVMVSSSTETSSSVKRKAIKVEARGQNINKKNRAK
jgi:hypothetical protein